MTPEQTREHLINRLTRARISQRITITDMAQRLGVTRTVVSGWENGRMVPTLIHAIAWAAELGINVFPTTQESQ